MANERVLIVDNSPKTVDFIIDYVLKPNNYQALVAHDGTAGLKIAIQQRPDLILLDINMPGMTGLEVLEALNKRELKIPVIMMTFHGSETLAVQAFRMGVKDYIIKPFAISEMVEAIEQALTEVRLRRERDALIQQLKVSNQALERRLKELSTLFSIGKSVTSLLDHDRLLSRLVEAAIYLTNADEGSLLLVDQETNELYMVAARGLDERTVRSFRQKVEDSLAGKAVTSGQMLMLSGEDLARISSSHPARSLIYIPLKVKERVMGVLGVANRHQETNFTDHDLRLLSVLADYAAVSLENVSLFQHIESEQIKLAVILNEIEEPVVVIGDEPDRQVILANISFGRVLGIDPEEAVGRPLAELLRGEAQTLERFIVATPEAGISHKGKISLEGDRTFYVTLNVIPEVGRAIVMQDITHLKSLDRIKSNFVATVARDLRVPLTSTREYSQMLATAGNLNEKQALFLERITSGLGHIAALMDDLLDLSAIEAGADPGGAMVEMNHLARQTVADFQEEAARKQQQLVCHASSTPAPVIGNESRLRQVVANLVDNAVRYTPGQGQISVLVQVEEKRVVVKVEDNGPGISPADLPFVFDKFFRIGQDDQGAPTRTGLGLAICKSIIESCGGHIWVESQPEQGSLFIFILPLAPVNDLDPVNVAALNVEALPA